jgi:16S rRNA (uracil1498-N3)-methyltransferase
MTRVYCYTKIHEGGAIQISEDDLHHIINVMRHVNKDSIHVFNECDGEWLCELQISRSFQYFMPLKLIRQKENIATKNIAIAPCIIKSKRMQILVEKVVELGVNEIYPVISSRSLQEINIIRTTKCAKDAVEQSNRLTMPTIHKESKLNNLLENFAQKLTMLNNTNEKNEFEIILLHQNGKNITRCKKTLNNTNKLVIIGPEGGFTNEEMDMLNAYNVHQISISQNVLRAETAAIAAVTLLQLL